MNTNSLIGGILVIIIIAGGWWFLSQGTAQAPVTETGDTATTETTNTIEAPTVVGTWRSTTDPKSVEVYNADGTTESRYDDEVLSTDTWELYTDDAAAYNPSGLFMRVTSEDEVYEYAIISLTADTLELSYLDRGNTLSYTRVQ